jgi:hypothetical protein
VLLRVGARLMNFFSETSKRSPLWQLDTSAERVGALRSGIAGLLPVLIRLIDQQGPIVMHVCASLHGEGTTTIAREIAAVAARWNWCNVALLDANRPKARAGCPPPSHGLIDIAAEATELPLQRRLLDGSVVMEASLIGYETSIPRVDVVRSLFQRLRNQFTLVVVDSPPVLASEQMAALCAAADCVALIVEAERTRADELDRARNTLEQSGGQILGVVLNKRRYRMPGVRGRRP